MQKQSYHYLQNCSVSLSIISFSVLNKDIDFLYHPIFGYFCLLI
uniref:Uncharacterized protein n=1 Tax=Arundo donax TaxID=35708 RepID=A0A0A9EB92_ARUDO